MQKYKNEKMIFHDFSIISFCSFSHCIPFENLKAYNNANELLLIHYTGTLTAHQYQTGPGYMMSGGGGASSANAQANPNGIQNVQKFVQSVNSNFAKIFITSGQ